MGGVIWLLEKRVEGRNLQEFWFGDEGAVRIVDARVGVGDKVSDATQPSERMEPDYYQLDKTFQQGSLKFYFSNAYWQKAMSISMSRIFRIKLREILKFNQDTRCPINNWVNNSNNFSKAPRTPRESLAIMMFELWTDTVSSRNLSGLENPMRRCLRNKQWLIGPQNIQCARQGKCTHPNLWVTGEFPRVAEEDLRLPGSYSGFTCCHNKNTLLSLTSIPENLVPVVWLLSFSSVPSALWESGMPPLRMPVSTATLFARSWRPKRSGFAEPLLDNPFSGVARPKLLGWEVFHSLFARFWEDNVCVRTPQPWIYWGQIKQPLNIECRGVSFLGDVFHLVCCRPLTLQN